MKKDRLRVLLLVTGLKITVAVAVILVALAVVPAKPLAALRSLVTLAQILAMTAAGMLLTIGGRYDRRAVSLGTFFLIVASAFAPGDALGLPDRLAAPWSSLLLAFSNLRLEVFLAVFIWLFVRDFPATPMSFRLRERLRLLIRWLWAVGTVLLVAELFYLAGFFREGGPGTDITYLPTRIFTIVFCLAAGVFLAWKSRHSAGGEKRRGRLFILAVVAGGSFVALGTLVDVLTPRPRLFLEGHPTLFFGTELLMNAVLLTIPFTAAYSVLVEQVLDVHGIARHALKHGVTRAVVKMVAAIPLLLLVVYLVDQRHLRVVDLVSTRPLLLAALAVTSLLALRYHPRMLEAIDRHFFPEQYNARRILSQLATQVRGSRDLKELAHLIGRAVALAWQIDRTTLVVRDEETGELQDTARELPPLDAEASLLDLLGREQRPLVVDLTSWSSPLRGLPEGERHWLVDSRSQLLLPTFTMSGGLNAVIVLGQRPGGLPYVTEDLDLLSAVASASGLVVELLELKHQEGETASEDGEILASNRKAMECLVCGGISPPGTERCVRCKVELTESTVPFALRRMFRFEERIGTGGMAVVFRATDLKLGRSVAVKTLPRVSPEAAVRLQREARTAATVSHPGLAAIYGIETWEGIPMVIQELLDGGTLTDRLVEGPLPMLDVIDTGQTVAQALEVIHNLGILHRDIKPSNIGYTRHGSAKLLDFGIARIYEDLRQDPEDPSEVLTVERLTHPSEPMMGTLCYFSPEALDEEPPDPTFDLWSLTVVLYEALTGTNLFFTPRLADILDRIRAADVPDIRERVPGCPESLARFFRYELHRDKSRRSQSGREYYSRLRRVWRELGSTSGTFPSPMARVS